MTRLLTCREWHPAIRWAGSKGGGQAAALQEREKLSAGCQQAAVWQVGQPAGCQAAGSAVLQVSPAQAFRACGPGRMAVHTLLP